LPGTPIYKNKSLKNLKGEKWQEIPFTEGNYVVSNYGRVKALARIIVTDTVPNGRRIKEKILAQSDSPSKNNHTGDYVHELAVTYCYEGNRFRVMTRRLVYEAFVQPLTKEKMEGKYVYPLDGNGLNCCADNLELATRSELRIRELHKGRYIPPTGILPKDYFHAQAVRMNKLKRRKIKKYAPDGELKASYLSLTSAAKKNNVSIGCISLCVQGKIKVLKGFVYRYEEENYGGDLKDWRGSTKKIIQYSIDGKKIKEFVSINTAARYFGISNGDISRSAHKITRQAGGFVWRFEGDRYKGEFKELLRKRKFKQCSPAGRKITVFESISVAAKETNGSYEGIRCALHKKIKTSGGFILQYM
jgi:hypothetical protein